MELQHCKGVSTKVEVTVKAVVLFLDISNILFLLLQLFWLRLSNYYHIWQILYLQDMVFQQV